MGEIEKFKEKLGWWEETLKIRTAKHKGLQIILKQNIKEKKKINSDIYQSKKELVEVRQRIKYYKSKIPRHRAKVRQWNLNHLGEVLEFKDKQT